MSGLGEKMAETRGIYVRTPMAWVDRTRLVSVLSFAQPQAQHVRARVLFIFAREAAGALSTRLSLRPSYFRGWLHNNSGAIHAAGSGTDVKHVIASGAKQSIFAAQRNDGLLRRFAPRNDGCLRGRSSG